MIVSIQAQRGREPTVDEQLFAAVIVGLGKVIRSRGDADGAVFRAQKSIKTDIPFSRLEILANRFFENGKNVIAGPRNEAQTCFCFVRGANDTEERMRVRFVGAAAAAGLLAFGLAGCSEGGAKSKIAQAQQVVVEATPVTASGCVRPVENTNCLVVKGRGGGYYDISAASPAPDLSKGVAISLQGKDFGKNTQCGRQLTDVKWSYLGIQCGGTTPASAPGSSEKSAKTKQSKAG